MVKVDGFNLRNCVEYKKRGTVTINGSFVHSADKVYRHVDNDNWYDERHIRVVKAVEELEEALWALIGDE